MATLNPKASNLGIGIPFIIASLCFSLRRRGPGVPKKIVVREWRRRSSLVFFQQPSLISLNSVSDSQTIHGFPVALKKLPSSRSKHHQGAPCWPLPNYTNIVTYRAPLACQNSDRCSKDFDRF